MPKTPPNTLTLDLLTETLDVLAEEAPKECRTPEQLATWVLICWARETLKKRPAARSTVVHASNGEKNESAYAV